MSKVIFLMLLAIICCAIIISQPYAAEEPSAGPVVTDPKTPTSLQGPQRTSQIHGRTVENSQGQQIGRIQELVISKDGKVIYAILSHGGFLGIGDRLIPIPWKSLGPGKDEKTLLVNITKETLEKAPNFEPKDWPNFTEPDWEKKVEVFYDISK